MPSNKNRPERCTNGSSEYFLPGADTAGTDLIDYKRSKGLPLNRGSPFSKSTIRILAAVPASLLDRFESGHFAVVPVNLY